MRSIAAFVALLALAGCGAPAAPTPKITITKPTDGTKFPLIGAANVDIPVEFTAANFMYVDPSSTSGLPVAGQGHAHLFVDAGGNYVDKGWSPLTAKGLTQGMHTLRVDLRNNDHTPVDGTVPATVMVEVVP